jgi:hypothetical protein
MWRAEEGFLLGDEIGAFQVTEQRARASRAAPEIERDREPDGRDPDDFERMAEPPAEIGVVEQQR